MANASGSRPERGHPAQEIELVGFPSPRADFATAGRERSTMSLPLAMICELVIVRFLKAKSLWSLDLARRG
jgi:hypothetical protein